MPSLFAHRKQRPSAGDSSAEASRPGRLLLAIFISALIIIPVGVAVVRSLTCAGPELSYDPTIHHVELVKRDAGLDEVAISGTSTGYVLRRPELDGSAREDMLNQRATTIMEQEAREPALKRSPHLASGTPIFAKTSTQRRLRRHQSFTDTPGKVLLFGRDGPSSLLVHFDDSFSRLRDAEAYWDVGHQRIAAWLQLDTFLVVGEVDPTSGHFTPINHIQRPASSGERAPKLFWRGDHVIICCQMEDNSHELMNCVLEIDLTKRCSRTIFTEEQWDPSRGAIGCALLSPDGRWLAFDRLREPSNLVKGGTCAGIWLLDLQSGQCQEITHESEPNYHHRLVRWDGSNILFLRRVGQDRMRSDAIGYQYDLYRARIGIGNPDR